LSDWGAEHWRAYTVALTITCIGDGAGEAVVAGLVLGSKLHDAAAAHTETRRAERAGGALGVGGAGAVVAAAADLTVAGAVDTAGPVGVAAGRGIDKAILWAVGRDACAGLRLITGAIHRPANVRAGVKGAGDRVAAGRENSASRCGRLTGLTSLDDAIATDRGDRAVAARGIRQGSLCVQRTSCLVGTVDAGKDAQHVGGVGRQIGHVHAAQGSCADPREGCALQSANLQNECVRRCVGRPVHEQVGHANVDGVQIGHG
jgi:hypothetical protein